MCWLWECNSGWYSILSDMSNALEGLNYMFYPKFRVRVQADQVKEKFGHLTFYYSVIADPPKWICMWHNAFQKVFDKIAKLDFKKVEVLDRDAYDEIVEKELESKEEFEKEKKANKHCSNVEVFEKDGKFMKKTIYHHYKRTHYIPTKHKLLHWLLSRRHKIENWLAQTLDIQPTHKQKCIIELVEAKAREIVSKAEKDCYGVCEYCGHYISDDSEYSPRCTTRGWIAYLCKDCADKSGQQYVMNGSIWQDGKEIMTKKEYAAEKAKIEKRFRKEEENEDQD